MTNHGYMVMTSKPKHNRPNGSTLNHQDRKKQVKFGQMSRFCALFFFYYHDVVHQEFLPQGRTVNKEYYLEVMHRFRVAILKKGPELWKNNS